MLARRLRLSQHALVTLVHGKFVPEHVGFRTQVGNPVTEKSTMRCASHYWQILYFT